MKATKLGWWGVGILMLVSVRVPLVWSILRIWRESPIWSAATRISPKDNNAMLTISDAFKSNLCSEPQECQHCCFLEDSEPWSVARCLSVLSPGPWSVVLQYCHCYQDGTGWHCPLLCCSHTPSVCWGGAGPQRWHCQSHSPHCAPPPGSVHQTSHLGGRPEVVVNA